MRYVAAYLLAVLGGNENPSAADIKKILSSVGIDAEDDKLKKVISELSGKKMEDLIAEGLSSTVNSVSDTLTMAHPRLLGLGLGLEAKFSGLGLEALGLGL